MPTQVGGPDVGRHVRDAREATGLSLRALARTLDVSPATLSELETGKTRMTVERLHRIAATLGRSVEDLLSADQPAPAVERPVPEGDWRGYGPLHLDAVLDAALTVFLRTGYHGASVRDVAAESGLSVAGIYHHHASKQEMLVAILDLTMVDLVARMTAARREGADPVARFALLVECLALFHTHRRDLGFVGASEMRSLEPVAHERVTAVRRRVQELVDAEVEDAVRLGAFATDRPHDAARAVVTMTTAMPQWFRPDGPASAEQVAAQHVRFALDLVRHRGEPVDGRVPTIGG